MHKQNELCDIVDSNYYNYLSVSVATFLCGERMRSRRRESTENFWHTLLSMFKDTEGFPTSSPLSISNL